MVREPCGRTWKPFNSNKKKSTKNLETLSAHKLHGLPAWIKSARPIPKATGMISNHGIPPNLGKAREGMLINSNLLVQWNHVMVEFRSKGLQPWELPPRNMVCGWRGIGASFCSSVFVDVRPLRCVQRCHKEWWVESCNFVSSWLLWFYSEFLDAACIGCDWVSISVEHTNRTKPHISILLPRQHPITPTGLEGKNPLARRHPKTPVRTRP